MKYHFHLLARAVIVLDNHVLLAHDEGSEYTFLVGGHVEYGEGIENTLKREIHEELGIDCEVGQYLGAIEHEWENSEGKNYEVNHIFEVKINSLQDLTSPKSCEPRLEFLWSTIDDLEKNNLQPSPLQILLQSIVSGDNKTLWASTLK
jgi:8-oxo-dGTP diphosphatase